MFPTEGEETTYETYVYWAWLTVLEKITEAAAKERVSFEDGRLNIRFSMETECERETLRLANGAT